MKSPVYCLTLIFLVSVVRAAAPESPAGTAEAALEKSDPIVAGSEPVPQETAPAPKRVQILISSLPGRSDFLEQPWSGQWWRYHRNCGFAID